MAFHRRKLIFWIQQFILLVHNFLETEIHTKPTDTHQYLLPSSCYPRRIIKNIPRSLALCIKKVCSALAFFDKPAAQLTTYLILR